MNQIATTPAQDASASEPSAETNPGAIKFTNFDFQHRVFKTPGARFLLKGTQHTPTFRVDMGDMDALIEIPVLRKEFNIASDSHDGKLIDLAVSGLRYVPDIKPGDRIPSEILDGTATWKISAKHKKIAQQRLQVQLLSWVTGKEVLLTEPKEIEMFLEQLESREKLKLAFREAAVALGHQADDTEFIVQHLELLAREICYIEALRDRFALVPQLVEKVSVLLRACGSDRNGRLELERIKDLLQVGIKQYGSVFAEADAQTGEIIAALKSIDRQVTYIRLIRDNLHFLLMQWEPHIKTLEFWHARRTGVTDKFLTALYRFLASRFTAGRSLLTKKIAAKAQEAASRKTETPNSKPTEKQDTLTSSRSKNN